MDLRLGGKVAIVTGGSKGIGRAIAIGFAEEGASVLVCARGKESLDETVALASERIGARGKSAARLEAIQADLGKLDDLKRVVARCVDVFGKIDISSTTRAAHAPAIFRNSATTNGSRTGISNSSAMCGWRARCSRRCSASAVA